MSCCGKDICTRCFYFSPHVRHTTAHRSSTVAVLLKADRCRREILSDVKPLWETVWADLARDISRASEKEAKQIEADPLGQLLGSARSRPAMTPAKTTAVRLAAGVGAGAEGGGAAGAERAKRPRSPPASMTHTTRVSKLTDNVSGDYLKRAATKPYDMWSHGKKTVEEDVEDSNSGPDGPPCPRCNDRDCYRMDYEDRGRKAEVWGSTTEDFITMSCRKCGHRWSTES